MRDIYKTQAPILLEGVRTYKKNWVDKDFVREMIKDDLINRLNRTKEEAEKDLENLLFMSYPTVKKIEKLLNGEEYFKEFAVRDKILSGRYSLPRS